MTRVDPEVWVSPDPGETVERATGDERAKALYVDEMTPAARGRHRARRAPGPRRPRLLRRPQGRAHVDQRHLGRRDEDVVRAVLPAHALGARARRRRRRGRGEHAGARLQREGRGPAVARPAERPVRRRGARRRGRRSGSSRRRSRRSRSGHRPKRRSGDVVVPDTGGRLEGIDVFSWTPREFIDDDLLQFCFTDANDAKNQIPFIRERVQSQLKRFAVERGRAAGRGRAARSVADPRRTLGHAGGRRRPRRADRRGPRVARDRARGRSSNPTTAASPTRRGPGA